MSKKSLQPWGGTRYVGAESIFGQIQLTTASVQPTNGIRGITSLVGDLNQTGSYLMTLDSHYVGLAYFNATYHAPQANTGSAVFCQISGALPTTIPSASNGVSPAPVIKFALWDVNGKLVTPASGSYLMLNMIFWNSNV